MPDLEQLWDELNRQPVHRFADWPNREVPKGKPGVYLIYQEGRWIYTGMSFKNLQSRLNQHASGRRSGDQFCVYVGDRLVMSKLSIDEMKGVFPANIPWMMRSKNSFVLNYLTSFLLSQMIRPLGPLKGMAWKLPKGRARTC
jgi:hypothetical protein